MSSAAVVCRKRFADQVVRCAVSRNRSLTDALIVPPSHDADRVVRFDPTGLDPSTTYYYGFEIDGRRPVYGGMIRTLPDAGPNSLRFGVASCSWTESNVQLYDELRRERLDFFIHMGDLHYENITTNDVNVFHDAYDRSMGMHRQRRLWRTTPIFYMWDDHDYGPNDSDSTSPARAAALSSYRSRVPYLDLVESGPSDAVYYKFEVGRVLFLVTDLRSMRTPNSAPDNASKTMMGAAQKQWFKDEIASPANAGKLIVWVNTQCWIAETSIADSWGKYTVERQELADAIAAAGVAGRMMIVAGDAHVVAIDDGTNSDFSTNGGAGIPVFQAAPLNQRGTDKGGTFSEGKHWGSGATGNVENQVGIVEIEDTGGTTVFVKMVGCRAPVGAETGLQEMVSYEFSADLS